MAKFLFATLPFVGHLEPMVPVARKLVERGHEVVWYSSKFFQAKVEATGARFVPITSTIDCGDGDYSKYFPERDNYKGLAQLKFDFKHIFIDPIEGNLQDLQAILQDFQADVLFADPTVVALKILGEKLEIPWVFLNISVLALVSRDTPPFGLGMFPAYSKLGRVINAALHWLSDNIIFADVQNYFDKLATRLGFTTFPFKPTVSPWLYLQPSVPSFEYVRTDLPPSVHFIGPLLPDVAQNFQPPVWWGEVTSANKPVVLVTQGTLATNTKQLIEPTLQALADEDLLVIATTGGKTAEQLQIAIPTNARVVPFIPFANLMPYISAYITNGGYGGVSIALAYGVPIISSGITEDKAEVGNRVAYSGVGMNLKTATPQPQQIRDAVKTILSNPSYRQKAQQMKTQFAQHDAATEAAQLLEKLAMTKQPLFATLPQEADAAGWRQSM